MPRPPHSVMNFPSMQISLSSFTDVLTCVLRSIQPLKMSTTDFFWGKGGRGVWLTNYHPCSAERRDDPGP